MGDPLRVERSYLSTLDDENGVASRYCLIPLRTLMTARECAAWALVTVAVSHAPGPSTQSPPRASFRLVPMLVQAAASGQPRSGTLQLGSRRLVVGGQDVVPGQRLSMPRSQRHAHGGHPVRPAAAHSWTPAFGQS